MRFFFGYYILFAKKDMRRSFLFTSDLIREQRKRGFFQRLAGILKESATLLGISIVAALVFNFVSPKGIAFFGPSRKIFLSSPNTPENREEGVFVEITDVEVAKRLFDSGTVLFVDARSDDVYREGHIKDAVSLPYGKFSETIEGFKKRYPLSTSIVTYCSGISCRDSHELGKHLLMAGYENIKIFIGGYPAWEQRDYPSEGTN